MKKLIKSDQRGIAHLMLILGVVVIVAIAGVGYYVFSKQKKSDSATPAAASNAAVVDACVKAYNDKDLCKFSGSFNAKAPYKATFASTDKDGKKSVMTIESDGKGNSSSTIEGAAYISLNGDTYMKAAGETTWIKYPKSPTTTSEVKTEDPTSDLKIETDDNSKDTTTYKKLGKEACGNATCFKYQVIDTTAPNTESIVWFGDKDYQLRKWSTKEADGSTSVGEFTYTSVTISVPSPVSDAPSTPSAADIQKAMEQAQQDTGTDEGQ